LYGLAFTVSVPQFLGGTIAWLLGASATTDAHAIASIVAIRRARGIRQLCISALPLEPNPKRNEQRIVVNRLWRRHDASPWRSPRRYPRGL